ncbi:MAG TPA: DUF6178 family protein [Anaeromyxobacter sp.]
MKEKPDRPLARPELDAARAALTAARGRKRLDILLASRNPQSLVRALPADELYLTIREIGLADAAPLVQLASADQFRVFLDLEAWSRDGFDPKKALPWLRAARAGAYLDPRAAARWAKKLATIDREVLYLTLGSSLNVIDLEQDPDPEIQSDHFMRTPEGKFVVEFLVEGTEYVAVKGLLDDLYAEDSFAASRLLSSLRWELPSELEETALRWRTARLADLGYPTVEEALSWFARPPRTPAHLPAPPARPPGFLLATLSSGSVLDGAIAALPPEDRDAVEGEIVAAANAVLVADGIDPADPDAVRGAFESARGYLELGLDLLASGDPAKAADALASTPVKRIFQEGFGRVLALSWRAKELRKRAGEERRLGAPLDDVLAALVPRRPRYFPGIEAPEDEWGTVAAAAHEPRHFRAPADLARTAAALDRVEQIIASAGAAG